MVFRNSIIIPALAAAVLFVSCAKAPEWGGDATLDMTAVTVEKTVKYNVKVSAGISNDNNSTAFTGMSGGILLKNGSTELLTLPFKAVTILPFEKGIASAETVIDEAAAVGLADQLKVDKEKFIQEKGVKDHFIEKENIDVRISSYDKTDIIKLLKDKVNEKSK
jgi:hypothetical protein